MTATISDKKFDPIQFKKQFPLFYHKENKALVYLDNAATTQKPQCVIDGITGFYSRINANANRSSHRLGRAATHLIHSAREKAAQFVNAAFTEEVVFTSGATEGLNIIANALAKKLTASDEVIISMAEHHANIVPWQEAIKLSGASLRVVSAGTSNLHDLISSNTKVISITAASNTLGRIMDLSMIKKIKEERPDIIVVIDASQLAAHRVIDVKNMCCDFLVFSAHKIYGPSGVGVLYGKKDILDTLSPLLFGGEMIVKVDLLNSTYINGPERFEAGTSPLSAIAGLHACFYFWSCLNRESLEKYEIQLTLYLHEKLEQLCSLYPALNLISEAKNNIGIAVIASGYYSVADIAFFLDEKDIAVRVGDHCAQPLWKSMGLNKTLRISLAAYNTFDDVDVLVACLTDFLLIEGDKNYSNLSLFSPPVNIDDLLKINNWEKKYKKIMQWGKAYTLQIDIRKNENFVAGCEANLWLSAIKKEGEWFFFMDSDSSIIKGLALLVIESVNKKTSEDIKCFDFSSYFSRLGLEKYLSQSRVNGLNYLVARIKETV